MGEQSIHRWAVRWESQSNLDGYQSYFVFRDRQPALFKTRREARAFRDEKYGYIRSRPDLQAEPHGWTLPKVERVLVTISSLTNGGDHG